MDTPRFASLGHALESLEHKGCSLQGERGVGGGCINSCGILTLTGGSRLFIKRNKAGAEDMFRREAQGLGALSAVEGAPPVPRALGYGRDGKFSFLLLECIESSGEEDDYWENFGRALARLHKNGRNSHCGYPEDNYIGASPQSNGMRENWTDFFRLERLSPQIRMARDRGAADSETLRLVERVMDRLQEFLIPCDGGKASLLHGDLWSGNFLTGSGGRAWLIDPAVYYGHREADLAMTRLFGGFKAPFYAAYEEEWPLEPGFSQRCDLYNLYHMLNHLNLFGSSYEGSVLSIARRYA